MNLYFRLLLLCLRLAGQKKRSMLEPSILPFRVLPHDCDVNMHLNNSRYLAFMDLGRLAVLGQAKVIGKMLSLRFFPVIHAVNITYIRECKPFSRIKLKTQLLGWDRKYWYMEQKFYDSTGQCCSVALVKGVFIQRGKLVSADTLMEQLDLALTSPTLPDTVHHWQSLQNAKKNHV